MKHFTIPELCASSTAKARGIDNTPDSATKENLISLIENILDPIRDEWNAPIIVTSGYRCPALNTSVGGKSSSWHLRGLAADLQPKVKNDSDRIDAVKALFSKIKMMRNLPFDRVLLEHNKARTTWWLHIAYDPQKPLANAGGSFQSAQRIIIEDYESNR